MNGALIVTLALLLDAVLGEPQALWRRVPHPVVLIGRAIGWTDKRFNNDTRFAGCVVLLALIITGAVVATLLQQLGGLVEAVLVAVLLAQRSLVDHLRAVARNLRQSLIAGRHAVARIVSRNTEEMAAPDVARAAIESGAENLSDGIIAPAFWALVGGLPGIVVYKIVNTADSMIGYRTARHENFGWAAARLDDVLNWVPARLTCLLLWIVGRRQGTLTEIAEEARRHKSPNAGWPEAALARSLKIALAGPRSYHGRSEPLPWVNPDGRRDIGATDIETAIGHLWRAWAVFVILCGLLAAFGFF